MLENEKPLCNIIATNIAKILKTNDWKLRTLSDEMGISEGTLSRKLSGQRKITVDDLADMSSALTKLSRERGLPQISAIDIITYPEVYVRQSEGSAPSERISVTFEVDAREKEYLLRLVQQKR